jgi:hypothetical protein
MSQILKKIFYQKVQDTIIFKYMDKIAQNSGFLKICFLYVKYTFCYATLRILSNHHEKEKKDMLKFWIVGILHTL